MSLKEKVVKNGCSVLDYQTLGEMHWKEDVDLALKELKDSSIDGVDTDFDNKQGICYYKKLKSQDIDIDDFVLVPKVKWKELFEE